MPKIGIVYSATTGIVLRKINPEDDSHFDKMFLAPGETLLTIDKDLIGADANNMPNLDYLIPYVKKNHGVDLKYGVSALVLDENGIAIDNVLVCPDLYQQKLNSDGNNHILFTDIGDKKDKDGNRVIRNAVKGFYFDSKKDSFLSPEQVDALPINDKPVFDKNDIVNGEVIAKVNI